MTKGWQGESSRHAMARMGIKTGTKSKNLETSKRKSRIVILGNGKWKWADGNKGAIWGVEAKPKKKLLKKSVPTKNEIEEEMNLHNADEVGINNQWNYDDAEYYLLLSDKYYKPKKYKTKKVKL